MIIESVDLQNYRNRINEINETMAKDALRVLGFAYKIIEIMNFLI